jgi:hypothetical protein
MNDENEENRLQMQSDLLVDMVTIEKKVASNKSTHAQVLTS